MFSMMISVEGLSLADHTGPTVLITATCPTEKNGKLGSNGDANE